MKKRGFTLIELMVVIAIIGLLAAVALPRFANVSDSAKVANVQGNLSSLRTSISMYYAKNDAQPNLVGNETDLTAVSNSSTGTGTDFTNFFGKNVMPETPAEASLTNTLNAIATPGAGTTGNIFKGNGLGGWVYSQTAGDLRANLATGVYGEDSSTGTDWTQF